MSDLLTHTSQSFSLNISIYTGLETILYTTRTITHFQAQINLKLLYSTIQELHTIQLQELPIQRAKIKTTYKLKLRENSLYTLFDNNQELSLKSYCQKCYSQVEISYNIFSCIHN